MVKKALISKNGGLVSQEKQQFIGQLGNIYGGTEVIRERKIPCLMLLKQIQNIRKTQFPVKLMAFAFVVIQFFGCVTEATVVRVMEPPPVLLADNIKKIGIINSSVPSEAIKIQTKIDQLVDAENQWLAKKGTEAAIAGLFDELVQDDRFGSIVMLDSIPDALKDFGADPESISWTSVEALCQLYEVDVIFSLSHYDTETKVSIKKSTMMQPNMVRVKVKVPAQEITLETLIENGWRIYDPSSRQLLDEMVFNKQFITKGKGTDALLALQAVDRKDTILVQSRSAGSQYGQRFQPMETSIPRYFYIRGSDKLVAAKKLIANDDWQGAINLWREEATNPEPKISSRACHNIAVAHERDGALQKAVEWATKANEQLQCKNSRAYLQLLQQRTAQNNAPEQLVVDGKALFKFP
jgi:hypothetical protein